MNAAPGYEVERLVVTAGRFQLLTCPWRHKVDKTLYLELLRMPLRLNIYVIAAINTSTAMYNYLNAMVKIKDPARRPFNESQWCHQITPPICQSTGKLIKSIPKKSR